ncbi:MAG: hypothetical protein ABIK38_04815 [candidate division WOR-3 bacterium]
MKLLLITLSLVVPAGAILYHIDSPVPISLTHGEYYAGLRLWGEGGVLARFGVGLFDRLTMGMSYSANHIIGGSTPELSRPRPELFARVAIFREAGYVPDLTFGFESQGYDYCDNEEFTVREKGVYLALGKTIEASRTYAELGVNWWRGFNGFIVLNQLLPGNVELIAEYDPALNDLPPDNRWRGGWLNFGIAWTFQERVRLGLALRDLLGNSDATRRNRVFDLSINEHF